MRTTAEKGHVPNQARSEVPAAEPSEETLRKMLEMQWQDHFQTRTQTWKALEISALVAVALVGVDWRLENRWVTIAVSGLLLLLALLGMQITLRHRTVEIRTFELVIAVERELGAGVLVRRLRLKKPNRIAWWDIFVPWRSNTPLFILRMYFIIMLFALCYVTFRLWDVLVVLAAAAVV